MKRVAELIRAEGLVKVFYRGGLVPGTPKAAIRAVDGVDLSLGEGEALGLVGESGSGKSTLGRLLVRLLEPTSGSIFFEGRDITHARGEELRRLRRSLQIVFQDPTASLNPRMKIGAALMEPLLDHGLADEREARSKVLRLLERVGLTPAADFFDKYPHQLSGGQRQRVNIARSVALEPKFLVADEPVSMVDVSLRLSILQLLLGLKRELGMSMLFITHDMAVASFVAERIAVMYAGKIVELGPAKELIRRPSHPYTMALLGAVPRPRGPLLRRLEAKEEVMDMSNPPSGCRFHPRCPFAVPVCRHREPEPFGLGEVQFSRCHFASQIRALPR
jgi:peptide/nickel transport system ATP-binding protein